MMKVAKSKFWHRMIYELSERDYVRKIADIGVIR